MILTYIHPDNLHNHWDFVKEGLDRIHSRSTDRWKAEDIYWMLKVGNYSLHIVGENEGFAIIQSVKGWDGLEMFVFCAYIVPGHDVMDEAFNEIKQIGKNIGAKRIRFQSMRRGWEKRAEQLGYKTGYTEYELEMT
jgi:hypothetical protein